MGCPPPIPCTHTQNGGPAPQRGDPGWRGAARGRAAPPGTGPLGGPRRRCRARLEGTEAWCCSALRYGAPWLSPPFPCMGWGVSGACGGGRVRPRLEVGCRGVWEQQGAQILIFGGPKAVLLPSCCCQCWVWKGWWAVVAGCRVELCHSCPSPCRV